MKLLKLLFHIKAIKSYNLKSINRLQSTISSLNNQLNTKLTLEEVKNKFKNATAVCFDVDSTVIQEEAIDELANFKGVGEQVAELTKGAMGGNVSFNDALRNRLNLIKPSDKDIKTFMTTKKLQLTPGIKQLSRRLQAKGVHVYLVSGGFRQMINPIAKVVAVPHHRIYANNILFNSNGDYESFDSNELTSKDGGKALVIQRLKDLFNYETIVMIGDGVTDLQARPPADLFIGFGGVVVRDKVKESADWFVTDFQELLDQL